MDETPKQHLVLIVDDEEVVRNSLSKALRRKGMATRVARSGEEALELLQNDPFDAVLLDIIMPDMDGVDLLRHVRKRFPRVPVIMITAYPTIETAIRSVKLGALDYLVKPFRLEDLNAAMEKITHPPQVETPPTPMPESLKIDSEKDLIVGGSFLMREVLAKIFKITTTDSTVLITGESGTGKELVARAIHAESPRQGFPFVAVDCSSLGETLSEWDLFGTVKEAPGSSGLRQGLLELANRGTLFLDEIANLSPSMQSKLLRFIQEREFIKAGDRKKIQLDIRILSSSNASLEDLVSSGRFREDLFYRLSVVPVHLPSLRRRQEDIPILADHFLRKFATKLKRRVPQLSGEALDMLKSYSWPGNVRELEHTIERILVLEDTDVIRPQDLPAFISQREGDFQIFSEEPPTLEELEKRYIRFVLRQTKGKKGQSAEILGINRKTLTTKIKKYSLY